MRGTGNHTPPAEMQPEPADNTSRHVMRQVGRWNGTVPPIDARNPGVPNPLIHTESAREIAAWWQSPGTDGIDFAAFASTGTITEDLGDAITREITRAEARTVPHWNGTGAPALRALLAYVRACSVPVWTVGKNIAGYTPESDVHAFLDYADALTAYRDMLTYQAPEDVTRDDPNEDCACVDGGELCEWHSVEAHVAAHLRDECPSSVGGRAVPGARPLGIVVSADSWCGSMSYWLAGPETVNYGEYLDTRNS